MREKDFVRKRVCWRVREIACVHVLESEREKGELECGFMYLQFPITFKLLLSRHLSYLFLKEKVQKIFFRKI